MPAHHPRWASHDTILHRIGIDLGGTKTEGILLDDSLGVLKRQRVPTPNSYDEIVDTIISLAGSLSGKVGQYTIGVCTPGTVSDGLIHGSNTQCLQGAPLKKDLEEGLGMPVPMENDANCFAVAEATLGSAQGFHVVFGVIMGTGVGGGIAIGGKIYRGRSGIAGEWGHHMLHPGGNPCYCGKNGCTETYLSGPALEKKWLALTGRHQQMPEIMRELDSPAGRRFRDGWMADFGLGLGNVIDILDPDAVVLGGGLSNVEFLYTDGRDSVYRNALVPDTPILKNHLGDSAGVYGAALL